MAHIDSKALKERVGMFNTRINSSLAFSFVQSFHTPCSVYLAPVGGNPLCLLNFYVFLTVSILF